MRIMIWTFSIVAGIGIATWLISFAVDRMRPKAERPQQFSWDPTIKPEYLDLDGTPVRYLKVGSGPTLVLLHTLRTQLDIFHKVIPQLQSSFTVYALVSRARLVRPPGRGLSPGALLRLG